MTLRIESDGLAKFDSKVKIYLWLQVAVVLCASFVGVVLDWEPDDDFPGRMRVRFLTGNGGTLRYAPWNLWVPKEILR